VTVAMATRNSAGPPDRPGRDARDDRDEVVVAIREALDVFLARWTAQRLASAIGFLPASRQEVAIAVSELATNILKYGVRGAIVMRLVDGPEHGPGLELIAEDEGPPLADLATAILDGQSDRGAIDPMTLLGRGGIGAGLGAIIRFTDVFEYRPGGPGGPRKAFRAVRYLRRPRRADTGGTPGGTP
jgi:anti-sigma regulatory factor (Ser/Thr protein kinase)